MFWFTVGAVLTSSLQLTCGHVRWDVLSNDCLVSSDPAEQKQ